MKKLLFAFALITSCIFAQDVIAQDTTSTININSKVTLTAVADGTVPITFKWYKDGLLISTGDTYIIPAIGTANAGVYNVVATNIAGSGTSSNLTIVVYIPPTAPSNVKITVKIG
jgi:hypothetical protein